MLQEHSSQGSIAPDGRLMQQPAWLVPDLRTPAIIDRKVFTLSRQGRQQQGQVFLTTEWFGQATGTLSKASADMK